MKNIQNLTIDINKKPFQTITANTGEVASRFVKINIVDKSMPVDLAGVAVSLYAEKPDGKKVFNSVTIEDKVNGIILAELTSQILATEGLVKLTLLLEKNNARLCTKQFFLNVDKSIVDDEAIESSNEFGVLTETLNKADEWNSYFKETSGRIEEKYTERLNEINLQLNNISNKSNKYYDTQEVGELFDRPGDFNYVTWCSGALRYDKNINKYVNLMWARSGHTGSDGDDTVYRALINADTLEVEELVPIIMLDSDGETDITPKCQEGATFYILSDGTYIYGSYLDNTTTWTGYRFTSTDYGKTWIKTEGSVCGAQYKMTELSSGRILASSTTKWSPIMYSDDKGCTYKKANIAGGHGGAYGTYVAEWEFVELEPGYVMAIGRKNAGGAGSEFTGDSDHALITYSTDYGLNWSVIQESTTIDNMNASNATCIVHDGIIEVFTCSRWYHSRNYMNNDHIQTGKDGAMLHYVATIEDAKKDNFTNLGVVLYANGSNNSAQDFHAPCLAHNTKTNDILIVYMDRIKTIPYVENNNYHFVKGSLGNVVPKINDKIESSIFTYSNKRINEKLIEQKKEILTELEEADFEKIFNENGVVPMADINLIKGDIVHIRYTSDGINAKGYVFDARGIGLNNINYIEYPSDFNVNNDYFYCNKAPSKGTHEIVFSVLTDGPLRLSGHQSFGQLHDNGYTGECIKYIINKGNNGEIPIATSSTIGGIKVGSGLSISQDGTLSSNSSNNGSTEWIKVADKTLSAESSSFEVHTDDNDTPLNSSNVFIHYISAPSVNNSDKKQFVLYLNNVPFLYLKNGVYSDSSTHTRITCKYTSSLDGLVEFTEGGFYYGSGNTVQTTGSIMTRTGVSQKCINGITGNITSVKMSTDGILGVGSRIIIYTK